MAAIENGVYDQIGTFNGNPLTMAAARATLLEVLTPDTYGGAEAHRPAHARRVDRGAHRTRASRRTATCSASRARWSSTTRRRATTASSCASPPPSATSTSWCSTTAACSCRRGARASRWTLSVAHTASTAQRYVAQRGPGRRTGRRAGRSHAPTCSRWGATTDARLEEVDQGRRGAGRPGGAGPRRCRDRARLPGPRRAAAVP